MAAALTGGEVRAVESLPGGLSGPTFGFVLAGRAYVLKRYANGSTKAEVEFRNLIAVCDAVVPTPEPVCLDGDGAWFDSPTVVMSRLPGKPEFNPSDRRLWIRAAADALVAVHELDPQRAPSPLTPRWQRFLPMAAELSLAVPGADLALTRLYEVTSRSPVVFSPDDYNPGNVLFEDGRLTGVVDWGEVAVEPRQAAVALYRHMLAIHPGGDAPELFLADYERGAGVRLADISLWDVLYGLRACRPIAHWEAAFRGHGLNLTAAQITSRSLDWITQALVRSGI